MDRINLQSLTTKRKQMGQLSEHFINMQREGLPMSIEAEMKVLAGVFMNNGLMHEAIERIQVRHFEAQQTASVFTAMDQLHREGDAIDIITVCATLKKIGNYNRAGGIEFLAQLASIPISLSEFTLSLLILENMRKQRDVTFKFRRAIIVLLEELVQAKT